MGKNKTTVEALAIAFGVVLVAAISIFVGTTIAEMTLLDVALGGIPILLGLIVVGVVYLSTHWKQVWHWIKHTFHVAVDWITSHVKLLVGLFGPAGALLVGLAFLLKHWKQVWGFIKSAPQAVFDWFENALRTYLVEPFLIAGKAIIDTAASAFGWIPGIGSGIKGMAASYGQAMNTILNSMTPVSAAAQALAAQMQSLTTLSTQAQNSIAWAIGAGGSVAGTAMTNAQTAAANKTLDPWVTSTIAGDTGAFSTNGVNVGNMALGQQIAGNYGWGSGPQWQALQALVHQEDASWSTTAQNPTSSAYGIAQNIGGIAGYGPGGGTAQVQLNWMDNYIKGRYGTPAAAEAFHLAHGYYDSGGWLPTGASIAINNTGAPEPVGPVAADHYNRGGSLTVQVMLDRKVVGQAVVDHLKDKMARL